MTKEVKKDSTQRIEYIDAMKGFSIILVVLHHVSLMAFGRNSAIDEWYVVFFMPLFFFISGFVIYNPTQQWTFKNSIVFLKKKIWTLILSPFVFFLLYIHIYNRELSASLTDPSKAGYWFTFMLFGYYIIYICIQMLLGKFNISSLKKDCILILSGCLLYLMGYGISYFYLEKKVLIAGFIGAAHCKHILFFILGTLAKKYLKNFEQCMDSSWFLPICISLYFLLNIFIKPLDGALTRFSFVLSAATMGVVIVFSFFRRYQSQVTKDKILGNVLQTIGRRTLDIYLLHYFFIPYRLSEVCPLFQKYNLPIIELACSLTVASFIIAFCLLISAILRISPNLGHLLFGAKKEIR